MRSFGLVLVLALTCACGGGVGPGGSGRDRDVVDPDAWGWLADGGATDADVTVPDGLVLALAGPAETCAAILVKATPTPGFSPTRFEWRVARAPNAALYAAQPDGAELRLLSASGGPFLLAARGCTEDGRCAEASTVVEVTLVRDADHDLRDDACDATAGGVSFLRIAPTTAPATTCGPLGFEALSEHAEDLPIAYTWRVVDAPECASFDLGSDDAVATLTAAVAGTYRLEVDACPVDEPGTCQTTGLDVQVALAEGAGDGPGDPACSAELTPCVASLPTCEEARVTVDADPTTEVIDWSVREAPEEAVYWLRPEGTAITLLSASPGRFGIEVRVCAADAPTVCRTGRAVLDLVLGAEPGADGADPRCLAVAVTGGGVAIPTCAPHLLTVRLVSDETEVPWTWTFVEGPDGLSFAGDPDGGTFKFLAVRPGHFAFEVRGCWGIPRVCRTLPVAFDVVADGPLDEDGLDPRCRDDLPQRLAAYHVLPDDETRLPVTVEVPIRARADVVFHVGAATSATEPLAALGAAVPALAVGLARHVADLALGVAAFHEFPCAPSSVGAVPFELVQRVTTRHADAAAAAAELDLRRSPDDRLAGVEALFQLATGAGRTLECDGQSVAVPAFDPAVGAEAGVADGLLGGAGFRDGSARVVLHATHLPAHAAGEEGYAFGATRAEATAALETLGLRVVGLALGAADADGVPVAELESLALESGAAVPTCAWGGAVERPAGCADDACCTGPAGAGRAPGADGRCPLVGLAPTPDVVEVSAAAALQGLFGAELLGVTPTLRADPATRAEGLDTRCFVWALRAEGATAAGCATAPSVVDRDGDGTTEGLADVGLGATASYVVTLGNGCVAPSDVVRNYSIGLVLLTPDGRVLGGREIVVAVPPR